MYCFRDMAFDVVACPTSLYLATTLAFNSRWGDLREIVHEDQRMAWVQWRRDIAENFNRLSKVHAGAQHVFKVGGPIPWSRILLPFYRKKNKQFGAVGYILTLYSSKSYVKSWGSVQILGRSGPPTISGADGCTNVIDEQTTDRRICKYPNVA